MLNNPEKLIWHIEDILFKNYHDINGNNQGNDDDRSPSAVLLLLGLKQQEQSGSDTIPCIILSKRARSLKQAGDLCCPGGRISNFFDRFLQKSLGLPGFPLHGSTYATDRNSKKYRDMALYLTTSLRESFEEMRLNPFSIKFLGPLPPQNLRVFQKIIYPMVGWVEGRHRFKPNHEVEKIVYIPLQELLDPEKYARYELRYPSPARPDGEPETQYFPCFPLTEENELLWGATFRIVEKFLQAVFNFSPPDMNSLPTVSGTLDENYFSGSN
jgi:hypothetical protein